MSSDILHAVRLLIERAPAADAADDVVERWGVYVVKLLDGLKARQPDLLSLPEIVSIIHLLQDIVDVRLKIAWLAWGSDWLPGTVIERCFLQLPAAGGSDAAPSPPHTQTTLPQATAVRATAPSPIAARNLGPTKESDELLTSGTTVKTVVPAAAFVAVPDHRPEKELDATYTTKRKAPNKAHSSGDSERTTKRVRLTTPEYFPPVKGRSLVAQLDMKSLREPRKVLYKCGSCESRQKLCLTVTRKGVIQNRCAQCIFRHCRCEWEEGHLRQNHAYREDSSSFYDPVGTAGSSDRVVTATTIPEHHEDGRIDIRLPPECRTAMRPPCGPSSAIKRRLSVHTRASPPLRLSVPTRASSPPRLSGTSTSPTSVLISPPAARTAQYSIAFIPTHERYSDSPL